MGMVIVCVRLRDRARAVDSGHGRATTDLDKQARKVEPHRAAKVELPKEAVVRSRTCTISQWAEPRGVTDDLRDRGPSVAERLFPYSYVAGQFSGTWTPGRCVPEIAVHNASFVTGPNLAFPLSPTSVALRPGAFRCDRLGSGVGQASTRAPPGPGKCVGSAVVRMRP